jgi:hypothetical protein
MAKPENSGPDHKKDQMEVICDFQNIPAGDCVDLFYEFHAPGKAIQQGEHGAAMQYHVRAETAELTAWILMPEGKEYRNFRVTRHETGQPAKVQEVKVVTEYLADDFSILAFRLMALKPGFDHEVSWTYK